MLHGEIKKDAGELTLEYVSFEEPEIRRLWDEIFADSEEFTDYYFGQCCKENKILAAKKDRKIVGMVHLNPYTVNWGGVGKKVYYIVGVAVKEEMRKRGIMKEMLRQAILDMKKEGCPFTFLMPKKREYYEGLGFRMVCEQIILSCEIKDGEKSFGADFARDVSMRKLSLCSKADLSFLADRINLLLAAQQYEVFSLRNDGYLKRMLEEYRCQRGDICLVCKEQSGDGKKEELTGLFAYAVYGETFFVERFEPFAKNAGEIMLALVLRLAGEEHCRVCEITMAKEHLKPEMLRTNEGEISEKNGYGIMALPVADGDFFFQKKFFFDEIV